MKLLISTLLAVAATVPGPVLAGDVAAGKSLFAARGCIGCHGANGVPPVPTYPTLKGLEAGFVKENLTSFRSGKRIGTTMNAMTARLTDSDIDNLAAYIATL